MPKDLPVLAESDLVDDARLLRKRRLAVKRQAEVVEGIREQVTVVTDLDVGVRVLDAVPVDILVLLLLLLGVE